MYLTIHWFVFGHSDPEKAKRTAKEQAIDRLVNNHRVDYVKDSTEAFALDSLETAAWAENVLDDIENMHVYGDLGPVRGSSGENRHSLQNLTDDQRQNGYMVDLPAHVKPGDDLFPETVSSNEVTVDREVLETMLNFVEDDPALDAAPERSNPAPDGTTNVDAIGAIAALREALGQDGKHPKVKRALEDNA